MVIGIIGAGISGLTAGRLLAKAGHEVTILEKSRGYGGRMATRYAGSKNQAKLDHGLSWFTAHSPEFMSFTAELLEKKLVRVWGERFPFFDGEKIQLENPIAPSGPIYTSVNGMNTIGKYLARWVDVKTESKVGGFTHIGANRRKKRSWMINMSASNTFEADAIIIATPAPQAYGLLNTTIDEIETLKIVREIDEVHYDPSLSLMLGYGKQDIPSWQGIMCKNSSISFISNEASKRDGDQETTLVVHTTPGFTRAHRNSDEEQVRSELLGELSRIAGGWTAAPEWHQLHFWRYSRPQRALNKPFLELESLESPLAVVGDYFDGFDLDAAYLSGYKLAKHWIDKFND
jgi:renalase